MSLRSTPQRKTKIVCTLGPASRSSEIIREMIESGLDVARLNFSHGSHEDHSEILETVREESLKVGRAVAVFQDLCGPKLRIGPIKDGGTYLEDGKTVFLRPFNGESGDSENIPIESFDPTEVLKSGQKALLSDGLIELVIEKTGADFVQCHIRDGGYLRSRAGIAVPDSDLSLPCITQKDLHDLQWAANNDIDYVALSFVGSANDVLELKRHISLFKREIPVIAKVERTGALDEIDALVAVADAVMVARGDLGLELPLERVPGAQKLIIQTANHMGTPVITATQMLSSMVNEMRPTRAEVSDVCTAVQDGTDCVMLSEETSIGKYPAETVRVLSRIVQEAEKELSLGRQPSRFRGSDRATVSDAVCYAASGAADKIAAHAILACTRSGYTARLMAKYRPEQPLFGATSDPHSLRRMALYWGVEPVLVKCPENLSTEHEVLEAMYAIRDQYGLKPGSRVAITAGLKAHISGTTSLMQIREIPRT